MTNQEYAKWAFMRMRTLVRAGHEHLRELCNKMGLATQGKYEIQPYDIEEVDQAIIDHYA